ncbi:hypothetical protein GCM10008018_15860 [Paenibacillus marchantiophytorum]|uniref:SEC-C domain-containing protein n=1 Tax=Paenibacillus marchantiophytorum TaxID=1619310 RepID=A0ABQ2BRY2_9BACL|nr:SEC-C metal-binding domain-containing protein [Paenibacillus marchantiophytorum]GGI46186.1 hypothetical protein GCM10008018_15860 [Paenibacillus marchantiophytorum]
MKKTTDLTWEEEVQFWQDELDLFNNELTNEGKLKQETIRKHLRNIDFLTTEFFIRYEFDYESLTGEAIVEFLGYFYISKMMNSSKSDIISYLPSIKKWAQFLKANGRISPDQCAEVLEVCKHKAYFTERFDQYMDAHSEAKLFKWSQSNDIAAYLNREEAVAPVKLQLVKPIAVNQKLLGLWTDGTIAVPKIVSDFQAFLAMLQTTKNTKLTTARKHLPRSFWKEIDEELNWQLFYKPTLNQDQMPLFQFFFYVAVELGLLDDSKQKASTTHQLSSYLALTEQEQTAVLLDTLWNKVQWVNLQETNEAGSPIYQTGRKGIASVLADWAVGQDQNVDQEWKRHTRSGKIVEYGADLFLMCLVSILTRFDLLTATFPAESEIKYAFQRTPIVMATTEAGNRVFRHFAGKEATEPKKTPLIGSLPLAAAPQAIPVTNKIGRNDPCPCGSGKKYKKCCL